MPTTPTQSTAMLHQHPTHPWVDSFGHGVTLRIAGRVAADVLANERWGAGHEGQPVYDLAGEDVGGRYLGDQADDSVRCQLSRHVVAFWFPRQPSHADVVEQVYRKTYGDAVRWEELRNVLRDAVASGQITADEDLDTAATRCLRGGYTVETLRQELAEATTSGHGTLYDATTGEHLGPATAEQRAASDEAGPSGVITVDRDLEPCDASADQQVYGPLRTVYVQP